MQGCKGPFAVEAVCLEEGQNLGEQCRMEPGAAVDLAFSGPMPGVNGYQRCRAGAAQTLHMYDHVALYLLRANQKEFQVPPRLSSQVNRDEQLHSEGVAWNNC
ncbi:unnamed protein product [Natator depressus]